MKYVTCIAVLVLFACHNLYAQYSFHSQNYVGLLEGERGRALQFHSINGVRHKTWFAGVGAGLDYYRYRTIPLFLSVNKSLQSTPHTFFASVDGGINFFWKDLSDGFENPFQRRDFSPSLYMGGGIGYKMAIEKNSLLLHIGYSLKRLVETQEIINPCFNPPCPVTHDRVDYRLNRLSLKLGLQF